MTIHIRRELKQLLAVSVALLLVVSAMVAVSARGGTETIELQTHEIDAEEYARAYIERARSASSVHHDASGIMDGVEYESKIKSYDWSGEDEEVLLRIAMAEAEGEGEYGMALVMLVVLNRTLSDDFPGDIERVVFQNGQFEPLSNGRYYRVEISDECRNALELVKSGWDRSMGALYFESCDGESWQSNNRDFLFSYKGHRFYA